MLLTVSKRLEFSASRRLFVPKWSDRENLAAFGSESTSPYGTGRNYVAYFVFSGRVNPITGMLINISEIKKRAGEIVDEQFDHKFLNEDNPAFRDLPPTAENIARQLFAVVAPRFSDVDAKLVACHLIESPARSATFYSDGNCEANYWFEFSAARQTRSPHLSQSENEQLFGTATSIHGHNYKGRLTFRMHEEWPMTRQGDVESAINSIRDELDHSHLNEITNLKDRPITTETLAKHIRGRVAQTLAIHRVRLHERDDFFAEAWPDNEIFLGMQMQFSAAHRLHVQTFSDAQNVALFGRCDNPRGHGHLYLVEATIRGSYDERTGTLYDFGAFQDALAQSVGPWKNKHLDLETEEFQKTPSTGENIVRALWPKVDNRLNHQLARLRLWETPNNRFTLRRTP